MPCLWSVFLATRYHESNPDPVQDAFCFYMIQLPCLSISGGVLLSDIHHISAICSYFLPCDKWLLLVKCRFGFILGSFVSCFLAQPFKRHIPPRFSFASQPKGANFWQLEHWLIALGIGARHSSQGQKQRNGMGGSRTWE